jgi:type II secretory ATPase GspE/PulE/Tfp pilus assembly ATPase PilB-like protein
MKLNAVNKEGTEFKLLAPFFEALLPAFEDGADEIRIEPAGSELKLTYGENSLSVPLPCLPRNYAAVAFSRILILSEMDIALEGVEQTGLFKVRYNQQLIPILVTSRRDSDRWFLIFRINTALEPRATNHN